MRFTEGLLFFREKQPRESHFYNLPHSFEVDPTTSGSSRCQVEELFFRCIEQLCPESGEEGWTPSSANPAQKQRVCGGLWRDSWASTATNLAFREMTRLSPGRIKATSHSLQGGWAEPPRLSFCNSAGEVVGCNDAPVRCAKDHLRAGSEDRVTRAGAQC